jgi:hypothetical protein
VLHGLHLLFDRADLGFGQSFEQLRRLEIEHAQILFARGRSHKLLIGHQAVPHAAHVPFDPDP